MSKWTEKPPLGAQINWSHPLSKGLVGAWLMNEGAGNKVNDLALRNNGVNNGATWGNYKKERCLDFNSSSVQVAHSDDFNSSKMTFVAYIKCDQFSGANWGGIVVKNREIAPGTQYLYGIWVIGIGKGTGLQYRVGGPLSKLEINYDETTLWHQVALSINNAGICIAYLDGKLLGSFTGTLLLGATYPLAIGAANCGGGTYEYFNGKIANVLFYNRIVSPSEIKDLYIAPYQFIYKPRRVFYSIPTGVTTWGHKIWGILNANIGKVNQVDKANIEKVNRV